MPSSTAFPRHIIRELISSGSARSEPVPNGMFTRQVVLNMLSQSKIGLSLWRKLAYGIMKYVKFYSVQNITCEIDFVFLLTLLSVLKKKRLIIIIMNELRHFSGLKRKGMSAFDSFRYLRFPLVPCSF